MLNIFFQSFKKYKSLYIILNVKKNKYLIYTILYLDIKLKQ